MTLLRLLPAILAALLMGAHLLRMQGPVAAAGFVVLPCLFLLRRRWVLSAARGLALAGAVAWLVFATEIARGRLARGEPWLRMAVILGAVAALHLLAARWLRGPRLERWFLSASDTAAASAGAFLSAFGLLLIIRWKAGPDLLLLERFLPGGFWCEALALSTYAAMIAEWLQDDARVPRVRFVLWSIFSAAFFLQLVLGLAGVERCLMTGKLHLPVPAMIAAGPIYRGGGLFMAILFLGTIVVAGPAWCSHLCYVGAWDNAFARLRPQAALPARGGRLRQLDVRWLTLLATVGGALLLRLFGVPGRTATFIGAAFGVIGVGLMAWSSRRTGRMVHCTDYCPIGALAVTLGRISPFRLRIVPGCKGCSLCTPVCRYGALRPEDIERGTPGPNCTLCGDCLATCRRGFLEYRFPGFSPRNARRLFVAVVAVLMAVTLGVARI
jgi:polyferredoxin